jgi:2-C-methyl-D-erythritol 2,4-cyclodiphosphate synthase
MPVFVVPDAKESLNYHNPAVDSSKNIHIILFCDDSPYSGGIPMRVGLGYDVHKLVKGRRLILGGVEIPFEKGLLGHSDADVLTHSICDALLGAAGLGDIGMHFPDSDPKYKGISSIKLLRETFQMISAKGFAILNIDTIVFAESPKLSPYHRAIQTNLSDALDLKTERINIKATTTEGLGTIGQGDGIAAMAVVLIQ